MKNFSSRIKGIIPPFYRRAGVLKYWGWSALSTLPFLLLFLGVWVWAAPWLVEIGCGLYPDSENGIKLPAIAAFLISMSFLGFLGFILAGLRERPPRLKLHDRLAVILGVGSIPFLGLTVTMSLSQIRTLPFAFLAVFTFLFLLRPRPISPRAIKKTDERPDQAIQRIDKLYRSFFGGRIAKYLTNPANKTPLKRIAVLGPWGEGKTTVLELIELELLRMTSDTESEFFARTIWVNPWKTNTREEAWEVLAGAFRAVQSPVRRFLTHRAWRWIRVLAGVFLPRDTVGKVLDAIESHEPKKAEDILKAVDGKIGLQGMRLFVFVDDMERADPEAVRAILPVIDRLSEMRNCYFLFAIDRTKIEDAFAHLDTVYGPSLKPSAAGNAEDESVGSTNNADRRSVDRTTGYLDKVMDVQLDLPRCERHEIIHWLRERVLNVGSECPRLRGAYVDLEEHLPLNPRLCDKFFKIAFQTELLYLKDYYGKDHRNSEGSSSGEDEYDFSGAFLVVLGDALYPGFMNHLAERVDEWKKYGSKEISIFVEEMLGTLSISSTHREHIIRLMKAIRKSDDPRWISGGFLMIRELPDKFSKQVAEAWESDTGSKKISEIIDSKLKPERSDPSDRVKAIHDVMIYKLREHRKEFEKLSGAPKEKDSLEYLIGETVKTLNCFIRYLRKGKNALEDDEKKALSRIGKNVDPTIAIPDIVMEFKELIEAFPIAKNESKTFLKNFRGDRMKAMTAVISALGLKEMVKTAAQICTSRGDELANVHREARKELAEIHSNILAVLSKIFAKKLKSQWWRNFADERQQESTHPFVILNPLHWFPLDNPEEFWKELLKGQELEALKDQVLLKNNIIEIVDNVFLRPLADQNSISGLECRELILDSRNHKYIHAFWELAMGLPDLNQRNALLELREQAIERTENHNSPERHFHITSDIVEKVFPLPPTETRAHPNQTDENTS